MNTNSFQQPQRQSFSGVLLIFLNVIYKFFRGFWALILLLFFQNSVDQIGESVIISAAVIAIIALIYSVLYYNRFLFHLNYDKQEFVLQKGVFSSNTISIPFDKIQQVDLKRSLIQRLIGVYSLVIDTAGSKSDEIEIKAISEVKAKTLVRLLTEAKREAQPSDETEPDAEKADSTTKPTDDQLQWKHRLSLFDLLKVGLTKSYFRGFLLMFAFLISVGSQLQGSYKSYLKTAEDYSTAYLDSTTSQTSVIIIIALLVFVLLLSVLITVGEIILKHYNLEIRQTVSRIEVEMGLKTNTKVSFQARRLQRLELKTNPLQKWLNLYEVQLSLASSDNNLNKSKIVIPGLQRQIVTKIKSFLHDNLSTGATDDFKPHWAWVYRRFYRSLLLLPILWGVGYGVLQIHSLTTLSLISILYLLVSAGYQRWYLSSIRLRISADFLIIRQGLWTQKKAIIQLYKMEGVSIRQPRWYRRRKLHNLTFHTAGGDVTIRAIPEEFLEHINGILYTIERSRRAWM